MFEVLFVRSNISNTPTHSNVIFVAANLFTRNIFLTLENILKVVFASLYSLKYCQKFFVFRFNDQYFQGYSRLYTNTFCKCNQNIKILLPQHIKYLDIIRPKMSNFVPFFLLVTSYWQKRKCNCTHQFFCLYNFRILFLEADKLSDATYLLINSITLYVETCYNGKACI